MNEYDHLAAELAARIHLALVHFEGSLLRLDDRRFEIARRVFSGLPREPWCRNGCCIIMDDRLKFMHSAASARGIFEIRRREG